MDVTKINLKVLLGACAAGIIAVLVSPTFLGLIMEPYRTLLIIFLGAAIPGGVALNANSPRQAAQLKRIAMLEEEVTKYRLAMPSHVITADANKPETKP